MSYDSLSYIVLIVYGFNWSPFVALYGEHLRLSFIRKLNTFLLSTLVNDLLLLLCFKLDFFLLLILCVSFQVAVMALGVVSDVPWWCSYVRDDRRGRIPDCNGWLFTWTLAALCGTNIYLKHVCLLVKKFYFPQTCMSLQLAICFES